MVTRLKANKDAQAIEAEIERIREEADAKIAVLMKRTPWKTRFKNAWDAIVSTSQMEECLTGYEPVYGWVEDANKIMAKKGLKLKFNQSTWENPVVRAQREAGMDFESSDSEYQTWTVFDVIDTDDKNLVLGHVKVKGYYSSYNGTGYDHAIVCDKRIIQTDVFVEKEIV